MMYRTIESHKLSEYADNIAAVSCIRNAGAYKSCALMIRTKDGTGYNGGMCYLPCYRKGFPVEGYPLTLDELKYVTIYTKQMIDDEGYIMTFKRASVHLPSQTEPSVSVTLPSGKTVHRYIHEVRAIMKKDNSGVEGYIATIKHCKKMLKVISKDMRNWKIEEDK